MEKLKKALDPLTCALVVLAVVLLVLLFQTRARMEAQAGRDTKPSEVVIGFLNDYLSATGVHEREAAVEKYFDGVAAGGVDHDGRSETLIKLDAVFRPSGTEKYAYRVCVSQRNYLELMLMNADGEDCPCRIGFYYRASDTGRIGSFTVGRLQPLDSSDQEWRADWL